MIMAIEKEIKNYSDRLRINIVSADGLTAGQKVIIMTDDEYGNIKDQILNMSAEIRTLEYDKNVFQQRSETLMNAIEDGKKTKDAELKELLEVSLTPIRETHKEQLEDKDQQIKALSDKIDLMQTSFHKFTTMINSLSAIDVLFRKKHNEIITDFIESVWVKSDDPILDTDVKKVTSKDD